MVKAKECEFLTATFVHKPERTAIYGVHFLDGHFHFFRPDPFFVKVGLGICTKYELTRSFKFANDEKLLFSRLRFDLSLVCHFSFSFLISFVLPLVRSVVLSQVSFPPADRPGARNSLPRTVYNFRATLLPLLTV